MIKAAAGGGGRGIRIADDPAENFERLMPQASAEAQAAFGDGGLYLEKLIERARHIEVQVLGDGDDVIHCFERECSLQRRRQKVWEEAPAAVADPAIASDSAPRPWRSPSAVAYRGAGTLEYLYDEASRRVLLHRDEHAHPGRASGDGDGHRHRPGARDDPDRRRRTACASRQDDIAHPRPRDRSAASTPRTRQRFHAAARHGRARSRARRHRACASTRMLYRRLHHAAVLRFAARQADRLGRGPQQARSRAASARSAS